MKFSTRTVYGLKAILVLAGRFGQGSLSVSEIAKRENISAPYLEQILNSLKKKGFVKSVRGPRGGYVLAKKPGEVTLENLFYVLEDKNFKEVDGKLNVTSETDEVAIGNLIFWRRLQSSIEKGMSDSTLKDLIDEARRLKKGKPNSSTYTFHI